MRQIIDNRKNRVLALNMELGLELPFREKVSIQIS